MLQETVDISFKRRTRTGPFRSITPPTGHADRSVHMMRSLHKNSDLPILEEAHFQSNFDPKLIATTQGEDIVQGLLANLLEETSELHLWLRNGSRRRAANAHDQGPCLSESALENSLHNIKGIAAVLGAVRLRIAIGEALAKARDGQSDMSVLQIRELIGLSEQTVRQVRRIVRARTRQPTTATRRHAATGVDIPDELDRPVR